MLDGMDLMIYSFVVPSLIALWHITTGQAGELATSALLVSSVVGWPGWLLIATVASDCCNSRSRGLPFSRFSAGL
jgi:hypothetical protein